MKFLALLILFFAQIVMADEYGVFMVVKGKVSIENPKATVEAKVGSKVTAGDTVITDVDSRAKIVMSDRNIINVSPSTKLKIEKYTNSANDKNVNLNLIEGKVRSNVEQKYDNKTSKFEIRTPTAVAGVRGTQFITSFDVKTRVTEIVTLRGSVFFRPLNAGTGQVESDTKEVVVQKGEKSNSDSKGGVSSPIKLPEKEIKAIDADTSVSADKKDRNQGRHAGDQSGGQTPAPVGQTPPLNDLTNSNSQIRTGPVERKYDKSKVKIITQPGS